jgi:cation diffusion facilitator family transporter
MDKTALQQEKQYLTISAIGNVLVACVGVTVAVVSSSQAIMLDGLFNLTYFATGLFTIKVASLVAGGDDERFPHGYAFFEPLVNGIKGTLVLGVSVMALVGAVQALLTGGRPIAAGVAIAYGVFASITCWTIALLTRRGARATGSPLVRADAENWIVNAAISSCVLLAFAGIFVLYALDLKAYAPYVDPIVVLAVVVISIGVPVRMAWAALMALLNKAPTGEIVRQVTEIVDETLSELPVQERFIRTIQPGRQRLVTVHVVLPGDYRPANMTSLDAVRSRVQNALCEAHVATIADVLFTADRQWGAPLSDGGSVGPTSS